VKRDFAEEVTAHMERAQGAFEAARTLCEAGFFDDAASRAYYAAFHAASAVLMNRGLSFKKHGAIISTVHKQLVHTGALSVEMGKWLTWLFELRSVGDYGEIIHVDENQARLALIRAGHLIEAFRRLLVS
jgi:uncharacterized protein (UPF0332 family)